ncbi:MAG: cysteine desulfurase family protein [Gemmatimonadales bacterium]
MDTHNITYLDNAATTRIRPEVLEAMEPVLGETFGNPSSAHRLGQAARAAVERARRRIAEALEVEPRAVLFTSGGTEADNLAVLGAALAARATGGPFAVAVSSIEHKAVLGAAHAVAALGGVEVPIPVDSAGRVAMDALDEALASPIAVVSVMWVNNEVGVTQDIEAVAKRCAASKVVFHTDAVQALGKIPCTIGALPIPLLSISGHKIGAPKGVGALICRDHTVVHPLIHGGGQQEGLRPGTENVAGAIGLAKAVELAVEETDAVAAHTASLRDALEHRVRESLPDAVINGVNGPRAPHISNISFPGTDSDSLIVQLDLAGIACASGSACTTGSIEPSHVLTAMGVPPDLAVGSLRFSFGKDNTGADVDRVARVLPGIVEKVRSLTSSLRR